MSHHLKTKLTLLRVSLIKRPNIDRLLFLRKKKLKPILNDLESRLLNNKWKIVRDAIEIVADTALETEPRKEYNDWFDEEYRERKRILADNIHKDILEIKT